MTKQYRFFYHYNKLKSNEKDVWWSIHFKKSCMYVKNILCKVPTETKESSKQPRGIVRGFCKNISIENEKAIIE